jgi:hypothetical protein
VRWSESLRGGGSEVYLRSLSVVLTAGGGWWLVGRATLTSICSPIADGLGAASGMVRRINTISEEITFSPPYTCRSQIWVFKMTREYNSRSHYHTLVVLFLYNAGPSIATHSRSASLLSGQFYTGISRIEKDRQAHSHHNHIDDLERLNINPSAKDKHFGSHGKRVTYVVGRGDGLLVAPVGTDDRKVLK